MCNIVQHWTTFSNSLTGDETSVWSLDQGGRLIHTSLLAGNPRSVSSFPPSLPSFFLSFLLYIPFLPHLFSSPSLPISLPSPHYPHLSIYSFFSFFSSFLLFFFFPFALILPHCRLWEGPLVPPSPGPGPSFCLSPEGGHCIASAPGGGSAIYSLPEGEHQVSTCSQRPWLSCLVVSGCHDILCLAQSWLSVCT